MAIPHFYPPMQPYAAHAEHSRGRLIAESSSPTRSEFHRDRDRIIHSTAFRRLKHKTQVFVSPDGDHFRTRLTHSLEVSQIARSLARALGLDEDLAETVALAHDLGHTPFGHVGEDALDACMKPFGGFDHNAQSLRIVTKLEGRYAAFDGLNLTWEALEGIVKHNGPLTGPLVKQHALPKALPAAMLEYNARQDLWLSTHASAEAQAAAIADDIAYNAHDIDDGLRAGLLSAEDLASVPFLKLLLDEVRGLYPALSGGRLIYELVRRVITRFVEDVIVESEGRIQALAPDSADAIRRAGQPVVAFSAPIAQAVNDIRRFLFARVYRNPAVMGERERAAKQVGDLFAHLTATPEHLPDEWRADLAGLDPARLARRVADYIAGMTDNYAIRLHERLCGEN